jgi:L-seryl-tRNA(Ser) seleniumtransferase
VYKEELKNIPSVDSLLNQPEILDLTKNYGSELVKYSIRSVLENIRIGISEGNELPQLQIIINDIKVLCDQLTNDSLKGLINATGVILHTNLGRAPLGKIFLKKISPIILGYSNLEFNLRSGRRGKRADHLIDRIKFITTAEDAVVVNNNAAAVSLILRTLVEGKEVIISRGELIEIGDSFRLPEIMTASGVKIEEIGTTNRTRLKDYKKALTSNTGMILKVHKSNYHVSGFTEAAEISELVDLAKKHNILLVYDIGSGLLRNYDKIPIDEPNAKNCLSQGVDLITFSCDKLLGGPQAGIIAGKKEYITRLSKAPLMRTYRVDKVTLGLLSTALDIHCNSDGKISKMPFFKMLNRDEQKLKDLAEELSRKLKKHNIKNTVIPSDGYCGGGSLPNHVIKSYSVKLFNDKNNKRFAQDVFKKLLMIKTPILGLLRQGEIHFNVLTLFKRDIPLIVKGIRKVL